MKRCGAIKITDGTVNDLHRGIAGHISFQTTGQLRVGLDKDDFLESDLSIELPFFAQMGSDVNDPARDDSAGGKELRDIENRCDADRSGGQPRRYGEERRRRLGFVGWEDFSLLLQFAWKNFE